MTLRYLLTGYDPTTKTLRQFSISADAIDSLKNAENRALIEVPVNDQNPLDDELARTIGGMVLMSLVSQFPELRPLALVTDGNGRTVMDRTDGGRKSPSEE
ncbi:hypothetical protein SBC1_69670 (plasmid) [Caballeronia sp. SBC1]|uniref:hypothetical protein n=1 Tax=Caballeronia sp. SBC1 TaxID=2705548 RepID=UPI0013E103AD|nr:hypothetical protein [Caballeronia sp. SBC1]QIE28865.1 hypothetical protein SBC2_69410 [Caballeronia sp. SBC2]QIN66920.1 hypothetical protein SBC1_69670 [Caballeronia sp. SBC1]